MSQSRRANLLGRKVMVAYKTIHIDRAGETGGQVEVIGEIVTVDVRNWAIVVTEEGLHLRCPVSKLYRAPSGGCYAGSLGRVVYPDYMGVEELVRDFHSAKHPVTLRWLDRRSVAEVIGTGDQV
jgi:hypothetical protein